VNLLDIVVCLLAVAAAIRGFGRGLLGQAFEFGGGLIGLVAGLALGPRVASALTDSGGLQGALIALAVVLLALSVGQILGFVLGHRFGSLARRARLGGIDSALGSAFSVAVTLVSYWLLGSLLVQGPIPDLSGALNRSRLLLAMNDVADPPDLLTHVNHYLNATDFPNVFTGVETPGPPVRLPRDAVTRAALDGAERSTVRVIVPACDGLQLGSGWVAAPDTIVTNAHVVAGGDDVRVEDANGRHSARVVLFDPLTDVAVLRVGGLAGPPLVVERSNLAKGSPGATLGYPGDGGRRLEVNRAAVQRRISARGSDIYGRRIVERDVYELHVRVRQGDSGGPFVLANGRVAGVVFAASTTHARIGYALTAEEVGDEIRQGSRAQTAVGTGECTH
jgi:uncharacterized membrane protein required for colicin V production